MKSCISKESERIPVTIGYINFRIDELNQQISECDYIEDVNGNPVYFPSAYSDEKRRIKKEVETLETILKMISAPVPVYVYD